MALSFDPERFDSTMSLETARFLGNSAYVLRLAGESRIASQRLQLLFGSPKAATAPGRRAYAAWQLSLIATEKDDVVDAIKWNDEYRRITLVELSEATDIAYLLHQSRIELLATDDIANPASLLDRLRLEASHPSRASLYALGLALCSSSILKDAITRGLLLEQATGYVTRFGRFAGQDILVLGTVRALEYSGNGQFAEILLREYFGEARRERGHPSFVLRRLPTRLQDLVSGCLNTRAGVWKSSSS